MNRKMATDRPTRDNRNRAGVIVEIIDATRYVVSFEGLGQPQVAFYSGAGSLLVGQRVRASYEPELYHWQIDAQGQDINPECSLVANTPNPGVNDPGRGNITLHPDGWVITGARNMEVWSHDEGRLDTLIDSVDTGLSGASAIRGKITVSPDGDYIAYGRGTSPFFEVRNFNKVTGEIGTVLTAPSTLPTARCWNPTITDDGHILMGQNSTSEPVLAYAFTGGAIGAKVAAPSDVTGITTTIQGFTFNGSAGVISTAGATNHRAYAWAWSGTAWGTRYSNLTSTDDFERPIMPEFNPAGDALGWANDAGFVSQPQGYVMPWSNTTGFGALSSGENANSSSSNTERTAWSPNGKFFAVGHAVDSDPVESFVAVYTVASGVITDSCFFPGTAAYELSKGLVWISDSALLVDTGNDVEAFEYSAGGQARPTAPITAEDVFYVPNVSAHWAVFVPVNLQ
jgi:hypothetical protein